MTKSPETAKDAAGAAAQRAKAETQRKLKDAKEKVGFGKLFKELLDSIKSGDGKEALKKASALIIAIFTGKLKGLKAEVEKTRKDKEEEEAGSEQPAEEKDEDQEEDEDKKPEDDSRVVTMPAKPANDNALPEDLKGVPYNSENILKCKDVEQCKALMKANGYVLDKGSGNYINPRWLSPDKILKEPMVEATIGGKKIRLKKSVMTRLKRADAKMFEETGEHIKVGEHFRSNTRQFELYKQLKPKKARVAPPGSSFHEVGQAVDLPLNWEKAQKYMWVEGFMGGKAPIGLSSDANHFSVGEIRMTDKRIAALEAEGIKKGDKPTQKAA